MTPPNAFRPLTPPHTCPELYGRITTVNGGMCCESEFRTTLDWFSIKSEMEFYSNFMRFNLRLAKGRNPDFNSKGDSASGQDLTLFFQVVYLQNNSSGGRWSGPSNECIWICRTFTTSCRFTCNFVVNFIEPRVVYSETHRLLWSFLGCGWKQIVSQRDDIGFNEAQWKSINTIAD